MQIIRGKNNGDVYTISLFVSLATMFLGPFIFMIPMLVILSANDPNFAFTIDYLLSPDFIKANMILEFIADIIPIALTIVIFRKVLALDFRKFKNNFAKYSLMIVLGFVAIIVFGNIISIIYELLGITGDSANQSVIESALRSNARPFMFIMIVFFAPFFEEMIFRKFLIGTLVEKMRLNKWIVFTISAVLFAGIHVIGDPASWVFFFQYLVLSVIITLSYIISSYNIYVPIGIHLLNNLLSFLLT